jgi:small subunit ribosomal protein S16
MSVKVRLRRMGNNKRPFFRVVATDIRRKNDGSYLEALGWYDPKKTGVNFDINVDRIEHWRKNGAILSETVASLVRRHRREVKPKAEAATAAA